MKLGAYTINGTPVNQLSVYVVSNLQGNNPCIVADLLPSGYVDISSIENWDANWKQTGKDYKLARNEIKLLTAASGWNNLTLDEKLIAAKWFVVSKSERDEVYTTEQQIGLGLLFHLASIKARQTRFLHASAEGLNRLLKSEADEIVHDIEASGLAARYIQFGGEGTLEGDEPGLFDYVEAREESPFSGVGLASKPFSPDGMTISGLVTRVMDILKHGNY